MGRDMKLLQATNRFYLLTLTVFFLLAGFVLYFFISNRLSQEIDEQLNHKRIDLIRFMSMVDSISTGTIPFFNNMSIKKIDTQFNDSVQYYDKVMFGQDGRRRHSRQAPSREILKQLSKDRGKRERIPYRIVHFQAKTRSYLYDVRIWQSEIESKDLIVSIFISLMTVFGVCCIILFVSNYYFSKRLLSPLLLTISSIKEWNIKKLDKVVSLETTHIKEFNELNGSLQKMITQLILDYHQMKEFTDNAAHELQTPVAIIRTKLETLMQSELLNDDQAQLIHQAHENTVRLSKINQTLLLLSKIENNQFGELEQVYFYEVFLKLISHFEDLIAFRELQVKMEIESEFSCLMNRGLAEILVSNLLSNAINHNVNGGDVFITIKNTGFEVCNTGVVPIIPTEQMFDRFKKGNHSSSNVGLGLALVKEIVDSNALKVSYSFNNGLHRVVVLKRFD